MVVAPLIYPLGLNLLQVAFGGLFAGAIEVVQAQDPFNEFGKADAVDFGFGEIIAKLLVEGHGNILVVGPLDGRLVMVHGVGVMSFKF